MSNLSYVQGGPWQKVRSEVFLSSFTSHLQKRKRICVCIQAEVKVEVKVEVTLTPSWNKYWSEEVPFLRCRLLLVLFSPLFLVSSSSFW